MNRIIVPNGLRKVLLEEFACSYPTVRSALNGVSSSHLSGRIRYKALQLGGIEVKQVRRRETN